MGGTGRERWLPVPPQNLATMMYQLFVGVLGGGRLQVGQGPPTLGEEAQGEGREGSWGTVLLAKLKLTPPP